MRGLSGPQRAAVTTAVEQLAWTLARELLELEPDVGPRSDLPAADLRQMWLAALRSLLAIRDSAEQLAASAALSAAQHGADYPAIGDAAGMTRQGARRKWPGLAGLSDERQRKLMWWNRHGEQFVQCARAVLAAEGQLEQPRLADLRARLAEIEEASPAQRLDAFDWVLVDAHAVALGTPTPTEPTTVYAIGLLAALTADAYAATNSHSSLIIHDNLVCGTNGCSSSSIVKLLCPDIDHVAVPACRQHAVEALRQTDNRIVTAYQADVALSVFTEAYGDDADD
ncbi:MAG: hypothetical protein J2P17_04915 [Mycobacterium sp.]|nr:hypothetical protein [Mycobacterium sp.]